jgi:hypothetical protein
MSVRKEMEASVIKKLGAKTWESIQSGVSFEPKDIWAAERPRNEAAAVLLQALYKDIHGISYADLKKKVSHWFIQSNTSIQHNVKKARKKMFGWANTILKPSHFQVRKRAASKASRPPPCQHVTLWVDSTDFPITGRKTVRKKDPRWSQKLKRPARRWMVVTDAKTRTQFIAGPHQPTEYDGDILQYHAKTIDETFGGETMIGDTHYGTGVKCLKKVRMIAPKSAAGRPKIVDKKKVKRQLSEEDTKINDTISGVRARCENPFGWVEQCFEALSVPFAEDEMQHNFLVHVAFACHRLMKG